MAVVALSSCQTFDPTKYNPTRVHPDGVGVEYQILKVKKKKCSDPSYGVFSYEKPKIINDMTGYVCLPRAQYQRLLTEYENYERRGCQD